MNEGHQRFQDWLTAGAEGDPPRDLAVHASVCSACRQSIEALDRLAAVNTGLASCPAAPTGRERSRAGAGRAPGGRHGGPLRRRDPGRGHLAADRGGPARWPGCPGDGEREPEPGRPGADRHAAAEPERRGHAIGRAETLTPLGTPLPTHAPVVTPIPRPHARDPRHGRPLRRLRRPRRCRPRRDRARRAAALAASPGSPEGVQLSSAAPTSDGRVRHGLSDLPRRCIGRRGVVTEVSPSVGDLDLATTPQRDLLVLVTAVNATGQSASQRGFCDLTLTRLLVADLG